MLESEWMAGSTNSPSYHHDMKSDSFLIDEVTKLGGEIHDDSGQIVDPNE